MPHYSRNARVLLAVHITSGPSWPPTPAQSAGQTALVCQWGGSSREKPAKRPDHLPSPKQPCAHAHYPPAHTSDPEMVSLDTMFNQNPVVFNACVSPPAFPHMHRHVSTATRMATRTARSLARTSDHKPDHKPAEHGRTSAHAHTCTHTHAHNTHMRA